jgi:hypothetical protein
MRPVPRWRTGAPRQRFSWDPRYYLRVTVYAPYCAHVARRPKI